MSIDQSSTKNTFVWYELNTTDKEGAKAFYTQLLGWGVEERDQGGGYTSLKNGDAGFGGLSQVQGGAPAHWLGYVDVGDLDARVTKLTRMGGTAVMPGMDIPDVGRIAVLQDPSGATFALYQAAGGHDEDWAPSRDQTGDFGWSEVAATDIDRAKGFYGEGFGWTTGDGMPTPGGQYFMWMLGEKAVGGLYQKPEPMPACMWTYYVNVEDVDATVAKASALGGQVLMSDSIPGMVKFAMLLDPQGACFGVAQSLEKA